MGLESNIYKIKMLESMLIASSSIHYEIMDPLPIYIYYAHVLYLLVSGHCPTCESLWL